MEDPRVAKCGHIFCLSCITEYLQVENTDISAICPTCETPLSLNLLEEKSNNAINLSLVSKRKSFLHKIEVNNFQSSTKLEALMQV